MTKVRLKKKLTVSIFVAELRFIDASRDCDLVLQVKVSKEEFELLGPSTRDILVVPSGNGVMGERLTARKLGNSYCAILPRKVMKKYGLSDPPKRVACKIFGVGGDKFLLIRLGKSRSKMA